MCFAVTVKILIEFSLCLYQIIFFSELKVWWHKAAVYFGSVLVSDMQPLQPHVYIWLQLLKSYLNFWNYLNMFGIEKNMFSGNLFWFNILTKKVIWFESGVLLLLKKKRKKMCNVLKCVKKKKLKIFHFGLGLRSWRIWVKTVNQ